MANIVVTTPEFRLLQNNLFKKNERRKLPNGTQVGNDKYGIEMLFSKAEHPKGPRELVDGCRQAMADVSEQVNYLRERIKDGDAVLAKIAAEKREKYRVYAGSWLVRANTGFALFDTQAIGTRQGKVLTEADASEVYAGSYGMAVLSVKFITQPRPGLVFYLQGYMKTRDGERLAFGNPGGGQRDFKSMFGGVHGGVSEQAPADLEEVF